MIKRLYGSRILRLFSAAVIDQGIISLANLALAALLIRYVGAGEYGLFVLVQVSIALLASIMDAWVNGPLSVLAPQRSEEQRDVMISGVRFSLLRFLGLLFLPCLAVPLIGSALGFIESSMVPLLVMGVIAGTIGLYREFLRSALRIRAEMNKLLLADAAYVTVLISGAVLAVNVPDPSAVKALMALAVAAATGIFFLRRALDIPKFSDTAARKKSWREMRPLGIWAAVGAAIYWVQSQSFNYALAIRLSEVAVGHVNASRLMIMPMFQLCTGVSHLLLPSAAGWLHHEGLPSLVRRLLKFMAVLLVMDVAYLLVLWVMRDWITEDLMRAEIPHRDLLILLWATHALLGMTREMLQAALLALKRFRALAWLSLVAAVAALGSMWFGVVHLGAPGAVVGTAAGELTFLIGLIFLLMQSLRRDRAASQQADGSVRNPRQEL